MSRNLWSEAETDYLITHYHTDSIKSIAKVIGRSYRATYRKAYQVGLTKRPRRNKYSEIEISAAYRWDYIAEHINVPDNELADVLELSPRTVYEYKKRIKRSDAEIDRSGNTYNHLCNMCLYACNGYYLEDGKPVKRTPQTYLKGPAYCSWADDFVLPEGVLLEQQKGYTSEGKPVQHIVKCPLYKRG